MKIKSISRVENQDVYCLASDKNGTMIANGIVTRQCDALRYAICSAFPQGEFSHPDEHLSIEQLKRKVYGDDGYGYMNQGSSGGYL